MRFEGELFDAFLGDFERFLFFDAAAADRRFQRHRDRPLVDRLIVDRDNHIGIVAVGEGQRQFQFAEQIFLGNDFRFRLAGQRIFRDARGPSASRRSIAQAR